MDELESLAFIVKAECCGVETVASIVVRRVSLSVGLRWLGWTQEHREDTTMYPGSGYQGPMSSNSSSLYSRAPKSGGYNKSV